MNRAVAGLVVVLVALSALPVVYGARSGGLAAAVLPTFDVEQVVTQARNRVHGEGDTLVAENAHHRAEFRVDGLTYLPKAARVPGKLPSAETGQAFRYRLERVYAGRQGYGLHPARPTLAGVNRVEYARGQGIVEAYLALDAGLEQLFVLNKPLAPGDVTVVGRIATGLRTQTLISGGLSFTDSGQEVLRYGQAIAFDAAGATTMAEVRLQGDQLALILPGEWLATAAYPVTLDPFIGGDILISRAEGGQANPALAYNQGGNNGRHEWLVVWQDDRRGTSAIYGQLVDSTGRLEEDVRAIWYGSDRLEAPAVAYDSKQRRYLVVWQNTDSRRIEGRILNADGTYYSTVITIPGGAVVPFVPRTQPAVAYNPVTDEYLVVWEYETAADNHDIQGCKVGVDGVVDLGGPFTISALSGDELQPVLVSDPADGRYLVVWRRNPAGDYNIVGRRLQSSGAPAGLIFRVSGDEATGDETDPILALNTGNGQVLVVWQDSRDDTGDIYGRLVSRDNSQGTEFLVSGGSGLQADPSVTWDPSEQQYLLVYSELGDLWGLRVSVDGEPLGESFAISEAAGSQWTGQVAFGAGGYLAVWADAATTLTDIVGQRLDASGELVGTPIGLSVAVDDQEYAALAFGTGNHEWLVVWTDERNGNYDIYGQFLSREGLYVREPLAFTHQAASAKPATVYNPDDDEFLVVWDDRSNGSLDIYGQRVGADGSLEGGTIRITSDPDDQVFPTVAYDGEASQYLVVWEDQRDDPPDDSDVNIYGQRLNSHGSLFGSNFVVCARPDNQYWPRVAFNPGERQYLVVWEDSSMGDLRGIAGQLVGEDDPPLVGNVIDIASGDSAGCRGAGNPSVTYGAASGEYMVVWHLQSVPGGDGDIYGRRLSGDGALLDSGEIAISTAADDQLSPHVSYAPASQRYYVCWGDERNEAQEPDIFGQSLSTSGSLLFTDASTNAPVWVYAGKQFLPVAASDPEDDTTLVVWTDERSGFYEIYGRLGYPASFNVFLPLIVREQ